MIAHRTLWQLLLWVGSVLLSTGTIQFEKTTLEKRADPRAETLTFLYPFVVTGKQAIQVLSITTGCACQVADLEGGAERLWQPGERGTLAVEVNTGLMTGKMKKSVRVHFSNQTSQKLTQVVQIEELITVQPRTQRWTVGEEPLEKEYLIEFAPQSTMQLTRVLLSNDHFVYRLGNVTHFKGGKRQQTLYATPRTGQQKSLGLLKLETDSEIPRYSRLSLFAVLEERVPMP